jgi:C4-type Zn-finger protein
MTGICPRCGESDIRKDYEAKEDGRVLWSVWHCNSCCFSWRDSEPPTAIDPAVRDRDFHLEADRLPGYPEVLAPTR